MSGRDWSPEEDAALTEFFLSHQKNQHPARYRPPLEDIAKSLGRSVSAIKNRLGLLSLKSDRVWLPEEKMLVTKLYPVMTAEKIAGVINRTPHAIHRYARILGLKGKNVWTPEQNEEFRRLYLKRPTKELEEKFDRSAATIHTHARYIGIARKAEDLSWTDRETDKLVSLYPFMPNEEVARIITADNVGNTGVQRTAQAIYGQAKKLGLKKIGYTWNIEEEVALIKNYFKMTAKELSGIIKRSPQAILYQAWHIGFRKFKKWTYADDLVISDLLPTMTIKSIAALLGRKYGAVTLHVRNLIKSLRPLTPEEIAELVRLFPQMHSVEIAKHFKRALSVIRAHAAENDLKKYEKWHKVENDMLTELYPDVPDEIIAKTIGRSVPAITEHAEKLDLYRSETPTGSTLLHKYTMRHIQRDIYGIEHDAHEKYGKKRHLLFTPLKDGEPSCYRIVRHIQSDDEKPE